MQSHALATPRGRPISPRALRRARADCLHNKQYSAAIRRKCSAKNRCIEFCMVLSGRCAFIWSAPRSKVDITKPAVLKMGIIVGSEAQKRQQTQLFRPLNRYGSFSRTTG